MLKSKQKHPIKVIVVIVSILAAFLLFGTMLADFILIKLHISPFFASLASEKSESGELTVGHGLLYSTLERKIEFNGGEIRGSKFLPGHIGIDRITEDQLLKIPLKIYSDDGTVTDIPLNSGDSSNAPPSNAGDQEDFIIIEDDVLNMETVHKLSTGEISAYEFMEKFPGIVESADGVNVYNVALPNEYAVGIEYTDSEIISMRLYDKLLVQYIDLKTQSIDSFLAER